MSSLIRSFRPAPAIAVVCALTIVGAQTGDAADQDEAFALRYLLGVQSAKFWVTKSPTERFYDSLAEYQALSELYLRAKDAAGRNDDRGLRLFLFLGFVAQSRNDAALSESLSADLSPVVTPRRAAVFKILAELPFLARPTCHYLRAYHGFEGRNIDTRAKIMAETIKAASAALPPATARPCVEELRR